MAHSIDVFSLAALSLLTLITMGWSKPDYIVDNENIEAIKGEEETIVDFSKMKCVRRARAFNGTFFIREDMDDDNFSMQFELYSSSNGNSNYKKIGMDAPKLGMCEGFKKLYRQFIQPSMKTDENTNMPQIPEEGLCPFPKGEYFIKEMHFDTENWPSQAPRGSLKAVIDFQKNGKSVGGVAIYMKITDK